MVFFLASLFYNKGVAISPKTLVLLPLPGMSTMCTVYSFPREGVGNRMYTMYTVYSFPRRGVGRKP